MADVMDVAASDALDSRQQNRGLENHENDLDGSPPPPPPRRRERDSRERRDDRDAERPPNRRERSPPPPPTGAARGERDRDYRRRSSPSPPYSHRDIRRSPPRRSPPPFGAKRSRRDDGGYDRRRGSPRGGFGDDRRYDYDYSGPGGRSAYADDRFSGRHSRVSDWPDSGRFDGSSIGVIKREGLMSYKQFIQELEDDISPAEAQRRYEEYRSEYISTQKRTFFEAHKEEEWLKDKYHPTNLIAVIERRNLNAKEIAKEFLLDLQNGTLDLGPGTAASISKPGQSSAPSSDDEAGPGDKRKRNGKGVMKDNDLSTAPKAHPVSSEPRRIQVDIELAQSLVVKLDSEKGVEENILSNSDRKKFEGDKSRDGSMGPIIIIRGMTAVRGLEGVELLDTLITYLWRIHGIDYYGMTEKTEPKGLRHVRSEEKGYDGTNKAVADWEKKLELFWQERLQHQDPLELMTAKDKIDAAAVEVLDPYVRKIRDEKYGWKYGCGAKGCTKLFHAAEFVHKHLRLKHPDLVMELTSKVRDDLYFQNYMNDPDAPGGTPVMQQPALKEKLPTRRPISDRLRDDRGNRRGYEDRYDRSEKSPSQGPDGENPDDPMYDAYDGQGLHGAPFPSDMPHPPVLMPVPGAGPLGPFVPAPPDVAMRLLREQGGPPPFEGSSGRGRKGRSGPSPILAVPPALPHDPRRIRSYQDLDAPEDEVTVIDYRSL